MEFLGTAVTDIGNKKKTNQDCVAIKVAQTDKGQVTFMILCDGMGGLEKGEVASATVLSEFCNWFEKRFPVLLDNNITMDRLKDEWGNMVQRLNKKIGEYGEKNSLKLGTTLTAILILQEQYYIVHVGDSRCYEIQEESLTILTKDQTFVAREIELGRMTPEEAMKDSRRNMLLQCVGASKIVEPQFIQGDVKKDTVYMLCSDGFRHLITEKEIVMLIGPSKAKDVSSLKDGMQKLVEMNKNRNETDNISVVAVRTF